MTSTLLTQVADRKICRPQRWQIFGCATLILVCVLAACGGAEDEAVFIDTQAGAQSPEAQQALIAGQEIGSEHSATLYLLGFEASGAMQQIAGCTAVRIRPDVILTAAHCFDDAYKMGLTHFLVTSDSQPVAHAGQYKRSFVKTTVLHPEYDTSPAANVEDALLHADVALGFLSDPDFDDDVALVARADGLDTAWEHAQLFTVAYGFGRQNWFSNTGAGVKRSTDVMIRNATFEHFEVDAVKATLCMGDSGAPLFTRQAPNVVLGIASGGSRSMLGYCRGPSYWTRLQAFAPWIDHAIAARCATGRRDAALCLLYP